MEFTDVIFDEVVIASIKLNIFTDKVCHNDPFFSNVKFILVKIQKVGFLLLSVEGWLGLLLLTVYKQKTYTFFYIEEQILKL